MEGDGCAKAVGDPAKKAAALHKTKNAKARIEVVIEKPGVMENSDSLDFSEPTKPVK
jgi:hypothetical protein